MSKLIMIFSGTLVRFFLAFVFTLVVSNGVQATQLTVTKTADTNDGVCDADCSFREAVAAADAAGGDDEIIFDMAVFNVARTITLTGGAINITGAQALTIIGTGSSLLTIDGSLNGILFVTEPSTATIANLKVTGNTGGTSPRVQNNGNLTLNNVIVNNGPNSIGLPALFNNLGTLTITGSVFQNNPLVAIFNEGGTVNVSGTTMSDNGFGIYNNRGSVTVSDSSLTTMRQALNNNEGSATLNNVTVSNNTNNASSNHGAGIVNFSGGTIPATMTITNSRISENRVTTGTSHGGGIANTRASLTLTGSVVHANEANANGGGIYTLAGTIEITNTSISRNTAKVDGGGLYVDGSAMVTISNSTIGVNGAFNNGGGLAVTSGTVNLNHATIANNRSDANNDADGNGSGVRRTGGTVNVRNTAIADNDLAGDATPGGDYVGTLTSQGYNLIENLTGTIIAGSEIGNIYGRDPELGRIENSSDPVITRSLLPSSPLIDTADPVVFLSTDQRGIARPQDGDLNGISRADIGAYERQVNIFTVTKTVDTNDGTCDTDCSLREAIARSGSVATPDNAILFDPTVFGTPQTIVIGGAGFTVPDNGRTLVIDGPGSSLLTLNGNNQDVWFLINFGETLVRDVRLIDFKPQTGVSPIRNLSWMLLQNILMTGNSTISGGGAISNGGRMRIEDSAFEGNSAPSTNATHDGGGAIETDSGTLTIYRSRIVNNATNGRGGGIRSEGFGSTQIFETLLSGNSAVTGGGIHHESSGTGVAMSLTNSTISGNTATGDGGGGIRVSGNGALNLTNVTIVNNQANAGVGDAVGGGIRNVNLALGLSSRNTIIANNTAAGGNPDFVGNLNSLGYNLIENANGVTFFGDQTGNISGVDPRLGELQDNGGPTLTHALLVASAAIDAAHPTIFPVIDQRGITRPQDGNFNGVALPDMGAFEFHPIADRPAPFDFDGDGKTDVGVFHPPDGTWWYLRSSDAQVRAFQFGSNTDKMVPADFTGDGKTDVAIYRPVTGEWFILRSENSSYYSFPFGASEDLPMPADYDGDGKADAAVFRPSNGLWVINRSTDGGATILPFGQNGDVPVSADYDGDGKADIAIYRPAAGEWWLLRSTGGVIGFGFGSSTDKPVQGDYTGDGKADIAIWRPGTGDWFVLRSENLSYYSVPFGITPDIPAPGDYDGDGKFDTTVFRPSTGQWHIQRSSSGTLSVSFGAAGDRPIPSAFGL